MADGTGFGVPPCRRDWVRSWADGGSGGVGPIGEAAALGSVDGLHGLELRLGRVVPVDRPSHSCCQRRATREECWTPWRTDRWQARRYQW